MPDLLTIELPRELWGSVLRGLDIAANEWKHRGSETREVALRNIRDEIQKQIAYREVYRET